MLLHKVSIENSHCLLVCAKVFKSTHIFANFTIGMTEKETGQLLKYMKLHGKCINIRVTEHMLKTKNAATSLKFSCKNLYSVNCYDKTNMKVFAFSLWEILSWSLTYFDQYIKYELRGLPKTESSFLIKHPFRYRFSKMFTLGPLLINKLYRSHACFGS